MYKQAKNKFTDNRLAEEWDLIVLTGDDYEKNGLPRGTLGTLILSYSRKDKPLYAEFQTENGRVEQALNLCDFRVLDENNHLDAGIILKHLINASAKMRSYG